jgi:uncharacterized protein (UPF0548 family)
MKRQWRVRRQTCALPEGQRRWDRAYQTLLAWTATRPSPTGARLHGDERPMTDREGPYADRRVCARLDDAPGGGPEH